MRVSKKLLAAAFLGLFSLQASAVMLSYALSDKDPGAQFPPDYGLRLDGLFDGDSDREWTFGFVDVVMDIDTTLDTVHIHGSLVGGEDVGGVWATEYDWALDFLYTDVIVGEDGFWHAPDTMGINPTNFGTLTFLSGPPDDDVDGIAGSDTGKTIGLADYRGGDFFLHADKGPYVSAWLAHTVGFDATEYERTGSCCQDFGFKATPIPEPTTLAIFGLGLVGLGYSRRRKSVV